MPIRSRPTIGSGTSKSAGRRWAAYRLLQDFSHARSPPAAGVAFNLAFLGQGVGYMGTGKEDTAMNKPRIIFDFNLGTLIPLLALALAGWDRYAALEAKVQVIDTRGLARMQISDTFQAETKKALADVASAPKDIVELKKGQEVANARMDRLADLMINGQDAMRQTMQTGFDLLRKDMSAISTKVEVVGSKVDMMTGKPSPGVFRPR